MKNKIHSIFRNNIIRHRIIPSLLLILSLALFFRPWIFSPVVAAYGGIFREASEITGDLSSIIREYTNVKISVTDESLSDISDGAFGPVELFKTVGSLRKTIQSFTSIQSRYSVSILDEKSLHKVMSFFNIFQIFMIIVLITAAVQLMLFLIRSDSKSIYLFTFSSVVLTAFFIVSDIYLYRKIPALKFRLTPWPFLSLALSLPPGLWRRSFLKIRLSHARRKRRIRKIPAVKRKRIKYSITAALLSAVFIFGSEAFYVYVFTRAHERVTDAEETNTDPVYSDQYIRKVLKKYGFNDDKDLDKIMRDSFVIPGLNSTRTLKNNREEAICTSMTPQGVTPAGDYLLISAYCATGVHNSVVYVINRFFHTFVKEIVLPDHPHVGGITYDPIHENIWICTYNDSSRTAYVSAFSMEALEQYSYDEDSSPISYKYNKPIYSMKRTSFLDYYNDKLYIGNFKDGADSVTTVQSFRLDSVSGNIISDANDIAAMMDLKKGLIVPSSVTLINGYVQGYSVDTHVTALSQSAGPFDSRLLEYLNRGTIRDNFRLSSVPDHSYTLPPMLEQITAYDNKLYLCFESASYGYRFWWNPHIDRIIVLDL